MAPKDIRDEVRESLGLPPPPPAMVPMEGHVCDFPLWSYSKKRTTVTELRIDYNDGSYFTLRAPEGMPRSLSENYSLINQPVADFSRIRENSDLQ